jgi:hypothetical protein
MSTLTNAQSAADSATAHPIVNQPLAECPQVCCIILSWNGWYDTVQCLESLKKCSYASVPTRVVIDLGENVGVRSRLIDLGGICMLDLQPTLAESGSYLVQKRIFDIAFSALFLLFTLPITIPIALAIKLSSAGPVFFCPGAGRAR